MRRCAAKILKVGALGVLGVACASLLRAELVPQDAPADPSSQSASHDGDGPTTRPGWRGGAGFDGGGGPGGQSGVGRHGGPNDAWRDAPDPTSDEWDTIAAFMRENSPIRFGLYERIENEFTKDRMITKIARKRIAFRYNELQRTKNANAGLYDFAFKQMRIEDDALGTLLEMSKSGESPDLTAKLKGQMQTFVDNSLNERQARLERLRDVVSHEDAALQHDRANESDLVDKQIDRFQREMKRMVDFSNADADSHGPSTRPADGK